MLDASLKTVYYYHVCTTQYVTVFMIVPRPATWLYDDNEIFGIWFSNNSRKTRTSHACSSVAPGTSKVSISDSVQISGNKLCLQ